MRDSVYPLEAQECLDQEVGYSERAVRADGLLRAALQETPWRTTSLRRLQGTNQLCFAQISSVLLQISPQLGKGFPSTWHRGKFLWAGAASCYTGNRPSTVAVS